MEATVNVRGRIRLRSRFYVWLGGRLTKLGLHLIEAATMEVRLDDGAWEKVPIIKASVDIKPA